ncbi:MAG: sulfite exporter TauE/SafE family protein [Candidatus Eisenbacteria bacterium]|nr:sulfite exporter TauE/SafE family protein [Candidatus Eisenbacteria bacterium]
MVGHAGASAYLAALSLYGATPAVMKPTALILNIVVATVTTIQFARAGHFHWRTFWPFALGSMPLAYLGGAITLPGDVYKRIVGAALVFAAVRLFGSAGRAEGRALRPIARPVAVLSGAGIGFLAGLTGVGGGIFLSPLVLLMRWADARRTAAVSAAFILVNSIAGLLGHLSSVRSVPPGIGLLAVVALVGGAIGATIGSRRLPPPGLRRALAVVLVIAAIKLFWV